MNLLKSIKTGSLIGKYLSGKESKEEMVQLKNWLNEDSSHQKLFNTLKEEKNIASSIEEFETYNKEVAWKRYLERMDTLSLRKILFRWKFAAVFFFLIGCAGILAYINKERNTPLASNENYTAISTNNGQNSKIILPDSSVVWINSGTTLKYNTNFAVSNRSIKLNGQAFFQIARNEKMPLTVTCNDLKVRVLGTKFDVSAYPEDKNISVVLESGSIELLHVKDQSFKQMLKPGEKAEFNTESRELSVSKVDSYNYTSWKDGLLIFKNEPMSDAFKKLERWYNIDIEVKNNKVNQLVFNATIVNESIEEILDLMKYSCAINYKIIPSQNPEVPVKVIISK
ncbi:MAG: DUF4974 domain-containing protein [Bacteroidetes bacterium]|nr:DUF4974 domain-containing protein [Bacteroidota bacterium]